MCLPPVIGKFDIRVTIILWSGWLYQPTHAAVCWPFTSPIYVAHLRCPFTLPTQADGNNAPLRGEL